ncbi:DUF11 domain-containing protein [Roseiconus nitratireducens]|uniref:DUF11 domain-containing protein n=1 Tax=Roseiconus nitratireducens TaxID=2605748 RepID=A0A5M6D190_9BACT|nr:DUF11 domain-containing protein [Roseiconus nitratireducens]KAA5540410.1 DUF11 domain-containing protein [Roseiconus nitratireducens]
MDKSSLMFKRFALAIGASGVLVVAGCQSATPWARPTAVSPAAQPASTSPSPNAATRTHAGITDPAPTQRQAMTVDVPVTQPSVTTASGQTSVAVRTAFDSNSAPPSDTVQQVRFTDRGLLSCGAGCGGCRACQSGANACQPSVGTVPLPERQMLDPQEFICNGGDVPPEARVLRDDQLAGVEPQDAVVQYTTQAGDIHVQPSSRVCLYSPRFGSVRQVSSAVAGEKAIGLSGASQPVGPTGINLNLPSLAVNDIDELGRADVAMRVDAMRDRNRGVPVDGIVQLEVAEDVLQILATLDFTALNRLDESQIAILEQGAVAAQVWTIRDAVEVMIESLQPPVLIRDTKVEALVKYDFPDAGRLEVIKVADKSHAQLGEEVTFAIHVRNVGDSEVTSVELADSLIPRLEYVEGSQSCDRDAEFSTTINQAGSLWLNWKLTEPLPVGETALIEFKCRVR